jgi:outer membrane protein OmpA-like peptidoglycan-associated protein
VLKEIAQAMTDNPDWKINRRRTHRQHGGDTYNLDLSKRRSVAVKQVLLTRYHIAADRLKTSGLGSAGALDTNDTLAGRASNRRVGLPVSDDERSISNNIQTQQFIP